MKQGEHALKMRKVLEYLGYDGVAGLLTMSMKEAEREEKKIYPILSGILTHFECERCAECCCDCPPTLSDDEVGEYLGVRGVAFLDMLDELVIHNALRVPCGFLEAGRCSIHSIKPFVCRVYPFSFKNIGFVTLCLCPMGKKIDAELQDFYRAYADQYGLPMDAPQEAIDQVKQLVRLSEELMDSTGLPQGKLLEERYVSSHLITIFYARLKRRGKG